jgi:hypothetical protein
LETFCVVATGPSLTQQQVDSVRDRCRVVVVSDAYRLAPWADALVSADAAWWKAHRDALEFPGLKFGNTHDFQNLPQVEKLNAASGLNSGLLGIMTAVKLGATRVLLLGFDLHSPGNHFFGQHHKPLKSTSDDRMKVFHRQFKNYRPRNVEILNCTPGSALKCYPKARLEDCLPPLAV